MSLLIKFSLYNPITQIITDYSINRKCFFDSKGNRLPIKKFNMIADGQLLITPLRSSHTKLPPTYQAIGVRYQFIRDALKAPGAVESSGGKVSYYRVAVAIPWSSDQEPYIAECGDVMEALQMDINESNVFKALWRRCAQRVLGLQKDGNTPIRDAEKIAFGGNRILVNETKKQELK